MFKKILVIVWIVLAQFTSPFLVTKHLIKRLHIYLFCFSTTLYCQTTDFSCGEPEPYAANELIGLNQTNRNLTSGCYNLNVKFHLLTNEWGHTDLFVNEDGEVPFTGDQVVEIALNNLSEIYNPLGIYFTSQPTNYINNNYLYFNSSGNFSYILDNLMSHSASEADKDVIDIYLCGQNLAVSGGRASSYWDSSYDGNSALFLGGTDNTIPSGKMAFSNELFAMKWDIY